MASLTNAERAVIRDIETRAKDRQTLPKKYIKIRPTQQSLLKIFKYLDTLKEYIVHLQAEGVLTLETEKSIERVKADLNDECSRLEELVSPGKLPKRRRRCYRSSLTCPGVHVRDILADAEVRTTQWLLDEKERYKKEAEDALMKKELQRKEKLLESQKNEVSKMTKYLDALTEVRQLREKANWKAGIGLPGVGEEEFLSDVEELKQCLAARTSLDEVNMS